MATIYLIRHGKSETNEKGIIGKPKAGLSAAGKEQADKLAGKFSKIPYSFIYTSNYKRAIETARPFKRNLKFVSVDNFNERYFGVLEDIKGQPLLKPLKNILDSLPMKLRRHFKFSPKMESDHEAFSRFNETIQEIRTKHNGKTILVFTHSNVLRIFLAYSGLADFQKLPAGSIRNCGYVQLRSSKRGLVIKKLAI